MSEQVSEVHHTLRLYFAVTQPTQQTGSTKSSELSIILYNNQ